MPDALWNPGREVVERANVSRLARRAGASSYAELHERSVREPDWFWPLVIDDLGLQFARPYGRVLDESRGAPWATWFVDGGINIATNCVDRHAASDAAAVVWESEDGQSSTLTYRELAGEVARMAGALRAAGVRKGETVGLFLPMTAEAVIAYMACCKVGAIAVPIFSGFAPDAVAVRLADAAAAVLVCADGFTRRGRAVDMKRVADEAADLAGCVRHMIVVRRLPTASAMRGGRDVFWDEALAAQDARQPTEDTDAEDPFLIAYTSGTTGRPKGSVHVHGGFLVKIAAEVAYQADYQPGERLFWLSDLGWIMGPWQITGTLALGGTIFIYDGAPDHPGPGRLWSMVERHRINVLGVSPTLVRALMSRGDEHVLQHDRSSLRILGSTGEPWNPGPYRWFFEVVGESRCPIINFSGGTEIGACFLSPTPAHTLDACSLGGPALGMAMDVWDPAGRPVRGGVGELVCTRPWPGMTRGLWGDPDRYLETYWSRWPGVWVHGDWASIAADGQWFLHGRSDDTMNVAGKRVGPAEVEGILVSHEAVAEAAVVGVPDEVKGETIWCYVVLLDDRATATHEALRGELADLVAGRLGRAFRPAAVRFTSELPKTRNAKVLRRAVRAVATGSDPGDLTSIENPSALRAIADAT